MEISFEEDGVLVLDYSLPKLAS